MRINLKIEDRGVECDLSIFKYISKETQKASHYRLRIARLKCETCVLETN